jgi:hypothetical protein
MNRIANTLGTVLITLFTVSTVALAQERSQADVQVRSMAVAHLTGVEA